MPAAEHRNETNSVSVQRPKRPMNAFMLFAKKFRMEFTRMYPGRDNRLVCARNLLNQGRQVHV